MKKLVLPALMMFAFGLFIPSGFAQVSSGSTNIADRVSRIILPDPTTLNTRLASPLADRPARPERPDFPPELKARLRSFENLRELYLARQEELLKKFRGANSDQDREQLRAQLQTLRDEWLDRARAFKEDTRTRLEEMKGELSPKYREALDEAKQQALDAAKAARKRRGDDP